MHLVLHLGLGQSRPVMNAPVDGLESFIDVALVEEVDEYDPVAMSYSYRMLDPNLNALPASSYSATLVVTPGADGGAKVEWFARAYRGDTGNEPPENLSDQAVKDALSQLFRAGLEGVKAKAEGRKF